MAHPGTAHTNRAFVLRRLHSLSGVAPVGLFLVTHLWTNAAALGGPSRFDDAVGHIQALPLLPLLEVFGILLPLAFHAGYGVLLAARGSTNVATYPFARNWLYVLQRVSGVVALVFILAHLWEFRVQTWAFGMSHLAFYPTLEEHLAWTAGGVPWIALGYLVGLLASVFHFANGLSTFTVTWGVVASRAAQARVGWACVGLGIALFALSSATVLQLATGTRLLPGAFAGKSAPCGSAPSDGASPGAPKAP